MNSGFAGTKLTVVNLKVSVFWPIMEFSVRKGLIPVSLGHIIMMHEHKKTQLQKKRPLKKIKQQKQEWEIVAWLSRNLFDVQHNTW